MGYWCSPLDWVERTFQLLVAGPEPLALHGGDVGHGLPARLIPLDELREMLLHPAVSFETRDAALAVLVRRAQEHGQKWLVGLAGMLLEGLGRAAARAARGYRGDLADVHAEVLAGFLQALEGFDPDQGWVAARLVGSAYDRGVRLRCRELAESGRRTHAAHSRPPHRPWGHPDLVLARAVKAGALTFSEAELISATRIGGQRLPSLAERIGVPYEALRKRRARAERRLVAWLKKI